MERTIWIGLATLVALLASGAAWLYTTELAPREVGLPVGAQAPAFTLLDQRGREQDLDKLLLRGKLALVFHRSADW